MNLFRIFWRSLAAPPITYGHRSAIRQSLSSACRWSVRLVAAALMFAALAGPARASTQPLQLVVLGDSLSAGYLLPQDAAFPSVLERALRAGGMAVEVVNAGVSGDTARGGLERLDWAVADGTHAVLIELGANDMLRGTDPAITKKALDEMITRLKGRGIKVMLAGMLASASLGREYTEKFNAIYPDLSAKHGIPLYPFFLEGVAGNASLNLDDGIHPNRMGVEHIVKSILPSVRSFLEKAMP